MTFPQTVRVNPSPDGGIRVHVVDDDVSGVTELLQGSPGVRGRQVEDSAALTSVDVHEDRPHVRAASGTDVAHGISARRLNFHNIRTEIRQKQCSVGARKRGSEIHHSNTLEELQRALVRSGLCTGTHEELAEARRAGPAADSFKPLCAMWAPHVN